MFLWLSFTTVSAYVFGPVYLSFLFSGTEDKRHKSSFLASEYRLKSAKLQSSRNNVLLGNMVVCVCTCVYVCAQTCTHTFYERIGDLICNSWGKQEQHQALWLCDSSQEGSVARYQHLILCFCSLREACFSYWKSYLFFTVTLHFEIRIVHWILIKKCLLLSSVRSYMLVWPYVSLRNCGTKLRIFLNILVKCAFFFFADMISIFLPQISSSTCFRTLNFVATVWYHFSSGFNVT